MNKKTYTPCEIEIVKVENADILETSGPSFSCPTDGLSCISDETPCVSEGTDWSNVTE